VRFALNENMPRALIDALRLAGHDVLAVKEEMRGASDDSVLGRAQDESRIVVTQDKDFGELAFRHGLSAACGVVLFRLSSGSPDDDARRMKESLTSRDDWAGHFTVVTEDRLRMRPLPSSSA